MNDISRNHRSDQNQRIIFLGLLIFLFFLVLWIRLWSLQVVHGHTFKDQSRNNYLRTIRLRSPRGAIYDRNGVLLAENVPSFSLTINREEAGKTLKGTIRELMHLLDLDKEEIANNKKRWHWFAQSKPVPVASNLTFEQVNLVESRKYFLPGVSIDVTFHRHYPLDTLACHVIGYVGEATDRQIKQKLYKPGDIIGKSGVEYTANEKLMGVDGWMKVEVDAFGKVTHVINQQHPVPGIDVYLTIDAFLQSRIEELFREHTGTVLVMEPATGEVLAMVSNPVFDPNIFADGITPEQWKQLRQDPDDPLINRVISGRYAPGSVFKTVTMTAALEEHRADTSTSFECRGIARVDGSTKRCWKSGGHGTLHLKEALANSCNIYFYNLGSRVGIEGMAKWARDYGLGSKTGINLPQEHPGLVPDPEWKARTFPKDPKWWPGETISVAIGQGSIIVTPLQIGCLISSLANDGDSYVPRIIKKYIEPQTHHIQETVPIFKRKLSISEPNLRILKDALDMVVLKGTARGCSPKWVHVSGKTGTVQIVAHKTMAKLDPEQEKAFQDHAWLATYGGPDPDQPGLSVVVFIEHGGKEGARAKIKITKEIYSLHFPEPPPVIEQTGSMDTDG